MGAFSCDSEHFSWWFGLTRDCYGRQFFEDCRQDKAARSLVQKKRRTSVAEEAAYRRPAP